MGRKRVAVWERVHQQVLQLPTRPALALPGTNSALVEISTTFFFFSLRSTLEVPAAPFSRGPDWEADRDCSEAHLLML